MIKINRTTVFFAFFVLFLFGTVSNVSAACRDLCNNPDSICPSGAVVTCQGIRLRCDGNSWVNANPKDRSNVLCTISSKNGVDIGQAFLWKHPIDGDWLGITDTGKCFKSINGFISCILPNVYMIAGLILFILLVVGGFIVITSAGKGDQEGTKKGGQAITAALIGFLIIFASYWIIQIIGKITGIPVLGGWGI